MRAGWFVSVCVTAAAAGGLVGTGPATAVPAAQSGTVVSPRLPLNVRSGSAIWNARLGTLPNGSPVTLACQSHGQSIAGPVRATDLWDRLTDGRYVSDAYVRHDGGLPACGTQPAAAVQAPATFAATVASGGTPLNARTGPARSNQQVAVLPNGTPLALACQSHGQAIAGTLRVTDLWDRLANGTYVSDAYVRRDGTPPPCEAAAVPGLWVHPLPGYPASHSFRNPPYHIGVDLMSFVGTPIHAAAAGKVTEVVCNVQPGASCDQPGSPFIRGCGWYVKIVHPGRIATIYCHMVHQAPVTVGQDVAAGQVIGYVGTSGNSSYPHLHFEVHVDAPPTGPQNAVDPIAFMGARGVRLD
jgi:murein DD-endopeptidase MepM/ murein hydrolase activator NlpD